MLNETFLVIVVLQEKMQLEIYLLIATINKCDLSKGRKDRISC